MMSIIKNIGQTSTAINSGTSANTTFSSTGNGSVIIGANTIDFEKPTMVILGGINITKILFDVHHIMDLLENPSVCRHPIRLSDIHPPELYFMRRFLCCKLPDQLIEICNAYLERESRIVTRDEFGNFTSKNLIEFLD